MVWVLRTAEIGRIAEGLDLAGRELLDDPVEGEDGAEDQDPAQLLRVPGLRYVAVDAADEVQENLGGEDCGDGGGVVVADTVNHVLRGLRLDDGQVTTVAGDLTTAANASTAVDALDTAINTITTSRATYGPETDDVTTVLPSTGGWLARQLANALAHGAPQS